MQKYKILINQNYDEWVWKRHPYFWRDQEICPSNNDIDISLNPFSQKLFTEDVVGVEGKIMQIIDSPIRNASNLPGILLTTGKTYGRSKNGSGKFFYKCIPNDKRLPAFLITYEQKIMGFNKTVSNKYILFKFSKWEEKHPVGLITQMIGDVSVLPHFYEYQLFCKNLNISIKDFTKVTNKIIKSLGNSSIIDNLVAKYNNIENRLDRDIISIDPKGSMDLDDAMGISNNVLSIYIANVPILIEYLNLWDSLSQRISTIYLPDRKRPMLPSHLSENLCSLLEKESRIAFCIDIHLDVTDPLDIGINHISYHNAIICVKKNYEYDEESLLNDNVYKEIFKISTKLCKKYQYIKEITDCHNLVAFLMILMNYECAKKLVEHKDGIFRSLQLNTNSSTHPKVPHEISNFIKIWQSSSGQYTIYDNKSSHDLIGEGIEYYVHITSPIRRLIDLINIMILQHKLGLNEYQNAALVFCNKWKDNMEYINTTMRSIRKVQIDCNLLYMCVNDKELLDQIYDGYIFDKIERENKSVQYMVYIPKIKIVSRINIRENWEDYSLKKFRIFLIEDGLTLKRKIRLGLIKAD